MNRRERRSTIAANKTFIQDVWDVLTTSLADIPSAVLITVLFAYTVLEFMEHDGPFELLSAILETELKATNLNGLESFLLKLLNKVAKLLVKYKVKVFGGLAFLLTPLNRPSKKNWIIFSVILVVILALRTVNGMLYVSAAAGLWIHSQLVTKQHKAFAVVFTAISFLLWFGYGIPQASAMPQASAVASVRKIKNNYTLRGTSSNSSV